MLLNAVCLARASGAALQVSCSRGRCGRAPSDLQAHELDAKHQAEATKAEKWQFEYKNLHDKYDALQKEKEVSRSHRKSCFTNAIPVNLVHVVLNFNEIGIQ